MAAVSNVQTSPSAQAPSQVQEGQSARRTHHKLQAAQEQAQAPAAKPAKPVNPHLGSRIDVTA